MKDRIILEVVLRGQQTSIMPMEQDHSACLYWKSLGKQGYAVLEHGTC